MLHYVWLDCFNTPTLKNVDVLCYSAVLLLKLFDGFWWNLVQRKITFCRCAYHKGSLSNYFLRSSDPLDFAFSLKNTLYLQLLLNPFGGFRWNLVERSQCTVVHITKGMMVPNCLKGIMAHGQIGMRVYHVPFGGSLVFYLLRQYMYWSTT
jgi:hypothetical protein